MYAAVIIQSNRSKLVIPAKWVSEKIPRRETKIFVSNDDSKRANFILPVCYFYDPDKDACYNAIYLKSGEFYTVLNEKKHNLNSRITLI